MWFGDECKNLLWAFTFLCQFGLNLLLTWAGDSALAEPAGSLSAEMRCVDAVTGGQVRGLALLEEACLRVCVSRDHAVWEEPSRKTGWKRAALSRVPW